MCEDDLPSHLMCVSPRGEDSTGTSTPASSSSTPTTAASLASTSSPSLDWNQSAGLTAEAKLISVT